jgi:competence protein ComEC
MPFVEYTLWKQAPFIRLLIPLMTGIITAWGLSPKMILYPSVSFLIFSGLLLAFIIIVRVRLMKSALKSAFLFILLFILGVFLTIFHDAGRRSNFAGIYLNNDSSVVISGINEPLSERPASWKATADIHYVIHGNKIQKTTGKAILYFQKTDSIRPLQYGDVILTKDLLQPIRNTGNPGAFDYERYARLQNIFYQGFLKKDSWERSSVIRKNILQDFFFNCRSWCLRTLSENILSDRSLGIAEALLAGYRDNLDKDLVQAYANAGVVHIIAISGLHLGLIYLILLLILKPLKDDGYLRWMKGALIIISLWSFAMITGASPSALRAAVMFSFIVAGKYFIKRQTNIYNTLAASAFLLLCYNPFLLFNVGFQLSYLAVLGIVIFQKPVFSLWISENKIWNYFWKMMSVSMAAELLTFPLAIYYFHRFPVMFLAANLVIIPLATFILYGEILLLVVSFFKPVAIFAGTILSGAIALMNGIIETINGMSFSGLTVSYTLIETVLIYLFIMALAVWLFQKNKLALFTALLLFFLFSISKMTYFIQTRFQKKMVVYNIPGYQAMDFMEGKDITFRADKALLSNNPVMQNTLVPARMLFHSVGKDTIRNFIQINQFIQYYNTKIAVIDRNNGFEDQRISFPVDYVLLSHNPDPDFQRIKNIFSPKLLIFDASNPLWKIKQWKTACDSLHLRCFSVQEEGAWVADIE